MRSAIGFVLAWAFVASVPAWTQGARAGGTAAEERPGHSEIARAKKLIANGDLDQAIASLRGLATSYPGAAEVHLLLGTALALVPRQEQALAALNKGVQLDPDSASAHSMLGMARARFGQPEAARKSFLRALELDPELAETHANLGLVLAQLSEFVEAREHLTRAIQLRPESSSAAYWHYLIGKTLSDQGQPREGAQYFEKVIRLRPSYAEAHLALGLARNKLLDQAGALKALETAVTLSPRDATAHYELGKLYLSRGETGAAIEHLAQADQLRPEDRSILFALVRALRQGGRAEQAKEVAERLNRTLKQADDLRQHVLKATELNNEAVQLEQNGRLLAALDKYRSALEMNPLHAGFRRNLGLLLCRLGQWDEGVAELREAARLDPEDVETTRALYIALDQAAAAKEENAAERNGK